MSVTARVEAIRIPNETLELMTDEALLQAIAEYPYLVDIYLYGDGIEDGVEVAREYFSALDELLKRESAAVAMMTYGSHLVQEYSAAATVRSQDALHNLFVSQALVDLREIVLSMSDNAGRSVVTLGAHKDVGHGYVYTPENSYVSARFKLDTNTQAVREAGDAEIVSVYGVTLISPGTSAYNCHSYAWNMPYTKVACWIEDPTVYTTDGSYVRTFTATTSIATYLTGLSYGDIILYDDNTHSAFFVGTSNSGAPLATMLLESKWGSYGVFRHSPSNVPAGYDYSTLTGWKEAE